MDTVSFSKTTPLPQVRIGDAERQAAARQLQQHFADGRLTWEELDERLAQAYAARVEDDLTGLFADLPMLSPPSPPAPGRSRAQEVAARLRSMDVRRLVLLALAAAFAICVTHGIAIPVFFIWWFVAGGRHGRHGRHGPWNGSRHHRSGPHDHDRAWG